MRLIETFKIYTGYPQQLSRILGFVNSIDAQLPALRATISDLLRRPHPFVLIFIQAVKVETKIKSIKPSEADKAGRLFTGEEYGPNNYGFEQTPVSEYIITDKPITLVASGEAPYLFTFQPDVAIANLQVAVICDVRMIRIDDICVANHHICPTIEGAPLAYHAGIIHPWHRITIPTSLR